MIPTLRAALAVAALLSASPATARAGTIWTALASEKIRPQTPQGAGRSGTLAAAKNEFEAFQVVVTGPATGVSVTASELRGPGTVPAPKLFREALIGVDQPSSADGGTGAYPDALVPDVDDVVGEKRNAFPFDVPAGESRAVWVEFHVPPDAAAGVYQGTVTVHAQEGDTAVPVRFTVWDFALPSTASLKSSFTLTEWAIAKVHGVSGEAETELRRKYAQLALDHRFSISNPWDDGQNGDWSHFDRAYGPLLDGAASGQLRGAKLTSLRSGADLTSAAAHADWAAHFKARGWFDRLFQYTCDEPPLTCQWSDIPARAAAAKQGDPDFRTLVTTTEEEASKNGALSSIDDIVPVVNAMDDRPYSAYGWTDGGEKAASYAPFLRSGSRKELWLYQSCMSHGCGGTVDIGNPSADQLYFTGWPSYMIDASATRARAMEWLSFRYGATGELYFETAQAYYDHDAWTSQWDFSGNGDGTLFYPGTTSRIGGQTDIPVASLRMKMIREGYEDYEYLKMLAGLGGAADAQRIAAELFPHAYQTDASAANVMGARETIARMILARSGKAVPPAGASAEVEDVAAFGGLTVASSGGGGGGGCASGGGGGLLALLFGCGAIAAGRRRSAGRARDAA